MRTLGFVKPGAHPIPLAIALAIALAIFVATIASCVVREERVERPRGGGCRGGVWVEGYRGPRGRWHPGHWRCPGVVERIEID